MWKDKMPVTRILLLFSWFIAFAGVGVGGFLIIFKFGKIGILVRGFSILFGSLLLAIAIRMFANIGQMIFDCFAPLYAIRNLLQDLKDYSEQLSCDSKDISQNMYEIRAFFEQIERHLDLKR